MPRGGVDPDYLCGLTPNMFITGRTHTDVPIKEYDDTSDPMARLEYITDLERLVGAAQSARFLEPCCYTEVEQSKKKHACRRCSPHTVQFFI